MHKQFLLITFALINSTNIMAMELSQEQSHHKFPSLKHIAAKHLLDNAHRHPCDHIDQLLAHEELCEDLHNDLKNEFRKKYSGYGFNEGFKSKKLYNDHAQKSIMKSSDKSIYILGRSYIKELDIKSNVMINISGENTDDINDIAYNKNKEILIAGLKNATIKLWNSYTNENIQSFNNEESIDTIATEADIFCTTSPEKIKIWDIASSTCLQETIIPDNVYGGHSCILNNDILYTIRYKSVFAWDLRCKEPRLLFTANISKMAINSQFPFSFFSAMGTFSEKIKEWDMRNFAEPIHIIKAGHKVNSLTTHGKTLYAGLAGSLNSKKCPGIKMFHIQQEGPVYVKTLPGEGYIWDVQANDTGLYVASTQGLTALNAKSSYDNVYKLLKDIKL